MSDRHKKGAPVSLPPRVSTRGGESGHEGSDPGAAPEAGHSRGQPSLQPAQAALPRWLSRVPSGELSMSTPSSSRNTSSK